MCEDPRCPKCGSDAGFFERRRCSHVQLIDFNGEAIDCQVKGDGGFHRKYCIACRRDITDFVVSLKL